MSGTKNNQKSYDSYTEKKTGQISKIFLIFEILTSFYVILFLSAEKLAFLEENNTKQHRVTCGFSKDFGGEFNSNIYG